MNKASWIIFLVFVRISGLNAQTDKEAFELIDIKFSATQINSNFDTLSFDYYDQASDPHHFSSHLNLKNPQRLYGGELNLLGMTLPNGIYWSGFGLGFYLGDRTLASNFYSGAGYVFKVKEKIEITPFLTLGYGRIAYTMEDYQNPDGNDVVIRYLPLEGNITARLIHNSFVVTPQVAADYFFHPDFAFRFTAGYRFDLSAYETVKFIEDQAHSSSIQGNAWSRNVPAHDAMEQNGQYIRGTIFGMNGFMLSAGILWSLKL